MGKFDSITKIGKYEVVQCGREQKSYCGIDLTTGEVVYEDLKRDKVVARLLDRFGKEGGK